MSLSTEELENFLELENKITPKPWQMIMVLSDDSDETYLLKHTNHITGKVYYIPHVAEDVAFIAQARIIAPQAVRELIEARELLCNHLIELQECRKTLSAYGHSSNWMAEIDRLIKRTREYLGE